MNGARECESGNREGQPSTAQVPIGWSREVGPSGVVYISPSGSVLSCLEQVKTYLLTDGTCKCGLECPLILHRVFNFDPEAAVKHRTAEDARADEDVTKLCIHKRKIIAVAALHRSMEVPRPSLVLTSPGVGTSAAPVANTRSIISRGAIRDKLHEGLPGSVPSDCRNPFKSLMMGQRSYQMDQSLAQQQELHLGHPRQRLGSGEHGQKSPYRAGHSGLLSPTSSGSLTYRDGTLSPRTDTLGSPDIFNRVHTGGFHAAGSPISTHGNHKMPLSPHGILLHGSPAPQPSCAIAGRTNVPLSPTHTAKSPVMKKPTCSFGMDVTRVVFHAPPPLPPSCTLQTKQVTSEKDPLGILDPIPSKPLSQSPMVMNPPSFQPGVHSQVPVMNVNIPPAVVPLPSNLPLPTVKPGPISHGGHPQRLQHSTATSSFSPSPVTSPVHVAAPAMSRMEASPQRSRSSSTSSDHGSFVMPLGLQAPCSNMKPFPRSPRSSVGSPRPSMPSSPSTKPDILHPYKELLGTQHGTGTGTMPLKAHPGLLGMPINQIFNQHNSASYPASLLLSAAAKAQLTKQSKLTGGSNGNGGHPGSIDGHASLPPVFMPGPTLPATTEGQSGRAALRDKLMAQQRELLRKRRQAEGDPGSMTFAMAPLEHPRKTPRPTGFHPAVSMAQLLQSISCQTSQSVGNGGPRASGPLHFSEGVTPHEHSLQDLQAPQGLHNMGNGQHCLPSTDSFPGPFPGPSGHIPVSAVAGCRSQGQDSRLGIHMQQIPSSHHHQIQSHLHARGGSTTAPLANGEVCTQTGSEQGNTSSLTCGLSNPQLGHLQTVVHNGHTFLHPGRGRQGGHVISGFRSTQYVPDSLSSNPMGALFQNFQVSMTESTSVQSKQLSTQPHMTSLSESMGITSYPTFLEAPCESHPGGGPLETRTGENMDAICRAVKIGTQASPIPPLSAVSAFAVSTGELVNFPHTTCDVIHGHQRLLQEGEPLPKPSPHPPLLGSRPHKNSEQGKNAPEGVESRDPFHSPGHGTPSGPPPWGGEEHLVCSAHFGASPRSKLSHGSPHFNSCHLAVLSSKERPDKTPERCRHTNGGPPPLFPPHDPTRQELPADDQSPSSSTSLEGPLAKDCLHYNGCTPSPSDTKSLSSEEDLRQPDSPASSELAHYRPRLFNVGDLVWGQIKGFPQWTGKLVGASQGFHPGIQGIQHGKLEPEKLKTLTEDLEALNKATMRNIKGGKLNNHLEAAIQEAMSELDKMSASMPRDRQVKPPKPKRRKISR
ncbi:methyl-CpG-binding domain protein 5-like [Arapaima gigas]